MKVICINNRLTREQKQALDIAQDNDFKYPFEVGQTYTVLGISGGTSSNISNTLLEMPYFYIFPTPLCLFQIIDDRPSQYWKIQKHGDSRLTLWPEEFYQEYFHDDLSNGFPEVVEIYKRVVEKLEKEFD